MKLSGIISKEVEEAVRATVSDLVRVQMVNGTYYVNLPMVYPDGSFVTVRLDHVESGIRVSDAGFAYRQADDMSASRSFGRTASKIAEDFGVDVARRSIFVDTPSEELHRAIIDVACASWKVADSISARVQEEDEELQDELKDKLLRIFGPIHVKEEAKIVGLSANSWDVSAIVSVEGHDTVFQAVSNHANSIYRTSTAFRDISGIKNAPRLVAVVRDRKLLGQRIVLLNPAKVIEESQPEELFRRVAA